MPDLTGQTIGPYRIVALLGKGGMAEVYRARQTLGGGVGRDVALKLIDVRLSMTPEFVARSGGKPKRSLRSVIRTSSRRSTSVNMPSRSIWSWN